MTTIAYKDRIIAYDSRVTAEGQICSDNCNKRRKANNINFFVCGVTSEIENFVDAYFNLQKFNRELKLEAFVYDSGVLYYVTIDHESVWRDVVDLTEPCAIGSGSPYAYTAMDLGLTAIEAVKMAKKRDSATGGKIRIFKLGDK